MPKELEFKWQADVSPFEDESVGLPIVYGTTRVDARIILQENDSTYWDLYQYFAISEGPIASITVASEPTSTLTKTDFIKSKTFLGADAGCQSGLPGGDAWINNPGGWTTSHHLKGIAGQFYRFTFDESDMNSVPSLIFTVAGRTITGNDDNPIDILKDYLTDTRYGAGIASAKLNSDSFTRASAICNELSGSDKRFTCNLTLDPKENVLSNIKTILGSCLGELHYIGGQYKVVLEDSLEKGVLTVDTISHQSDHTNGTHTSVALTGGTGSGVIATVVVSGNAVLSVTVTTEGNGYVVDDTLTIPHATIGGTGPVTCDVATINSPNNGQPVVAFDSSHIIDGITVIADSKKTKANQVIVTWINPSDEYQPNEVAWPDPNNETSDYNSFLAEDNGLPLVKKVDIKGCTNYQQARYIAKILCKKSRRNTRLTIKTTAESANLIPGDIATVTHSTMGWTAKQFKVTKVSMSPKSGFSLDLEEHYNSFYSRDSGTALDSITASTLRDPSVISAVSNLSGTEVIYSTREGRGVANKVTLSWTDIADNFLESYLVSYKDSGDSAYQFVGSTKEVTMDVTDIGISTFDFRVVSRNIEGVESSASTVQVVTDGLSTPPSQITGFSVNSMGTLALATWNVSTDLDVVQGGYYRIAHSVDNTAKNWDNAVVITPRINGNATSCIVPLLAGTYMVRATDSTDQKGLPAVFVHDGTAIQPLSLAGSLTEETDFGGTKTRMVVIDPLTNPRLVLDSELYIDDASIDDLDDDISDFDSLDGVYWNQGDSAGNWSGSTPTYSFENYLDLGSVQATRLRAYIKHITVNITDFIDTRSGYIDTWTDFDNLGDGLTNIRMEFSSTNDDPAGSPSWGDWKDFYVSETTARAFKFRIFPETLATSHNVQIENLRVYAEIQA